MLVRLFEALILIRFDDSHVRACACRQFTLATDAIQVLTLVVTGNYAFNFWGVGEGDGSGMLSFQPAHGLLLCVKECGLCGCGYRLDLSEDPYQLSQ